MSKSRQRKGDKAQKLIAKFFKDSGYLVEIPVRSKWHREDFFNAWDIIAIKENEIRFIQISTVAFYRRGIEYKKKLADFPSGHWSKEYWWVKEDDNIQTWQGNDLSEVNKTTLSTLANTTT
jgi:hypothetical protein